MTSAIVRALAVAALVALVAGCASQTGTVVLLPEKDGKDTAVTVKQRDGQVELREPYAAAKLTTAGPQAYKSNPEEVKALFGPALAAQPGRPVQFTLQFVEGKDELTEESKLVVDSVFAEIAKRPVPDVVVIGHTDAVGSDQYNDALSQQRAEVIRAGLDQERHRAGEHPGRRSRQARAGGADRRRRGGAAQPARRHHRPLTPPPAGPARNRRASTRQRHPAGPGPCQRSARIVRSSEGSAPATKASTSARSASTTSRALVLPRPISGRSAATRALPYSAPARIAGLGHAVGHRAKELARSQRDVRAAIGEIGERAKRRAVAVLDAASGRIGRMDQVRVLVSRVAVLELARSRGRESRRTR